MRLDEKVGDYLLKVDIGEREVGIEIEMEAELPFPPVETTRYYWKKEHDGSLRGEYTMEYVLRKPLKRTTAMKALDKLSIALDMEGTTVVDSVRAGTHVHINVRDLTFRELWSMVTCWYVLEELLTHTMCGEGRVGNHFCLGAQDADAVVFKVSKALRNKALRQLAHDDIRYSALNFVSLFKYGSLEFRAMRTPIDFEIIKTWVGILLAIKENSKLFPNPRHVVENFSYGGERNFLRQVIGNENAEMIIRRDPDRWEEKLRRGVRVAQELAYARDDWDKEEEEVKPLTKDDAWKIFAREFGVEIEDDVDE